MVERIAWGLLAALHLMPALAFFSPALIARLYGVEAGGTAFALLQHRAALFALVVVICIAAIFDPAVRRLAVVAVAISMISFLLVYATSGQPPALRGIAIADLIGLVPLAYVAWRAFVA
ncbi:hypothetical protein [Glacieibacterium frigidum]|uniref:Phosphopantetheine adenylyltransferase n=1 Tax=Glacieibacterium frigidum TaxID=2593303 RepID=A0A552UH01_9SPHN|nr:hypothetical protein [Glacieibacterium frigidum]TRW17471.1 hypothetical protein FMM06_04730 [Glacieibacterium frigidum]